MLPPTATLLAWRRNWRLRSRLALLVYFFWAIPLGQAQFSIPDDLPVSGLVSNGVMDRVYVSAGVKVYSLSQDLQELDEIAVGSMDVSGMAVSDDGQWLVVCSQDRSCRVVNGSALDAMPNVSEENAIAGGTGGVAVFTDTGNTFYTGGVGNIDSGGSVATNRHVFGQFGFAGSNVSRLINPLVPAVGSTETGSRVMYGGFYKSPYAYYLAVDGGDEIRIVRVCDDTAAETLDFNAVYEVELVCGSVSVDQLAGVSLVDGVTLILGVTSSTSSAVCSYNLSAINNAMDDFYRDCLVDNLLLSNNVDAWDGNVYDSSCSSYGQPISMCDFGVTSSSVPRVIAPAATSSDDLDTVVTGIGPSVLNGLTQSMAIVVDQQMFLYLGYSDSDGHYLSKYHLNGNVATMVDITSLSSAVSALSWSQGSDYVYVAIEPVQATPPSETVAAEVLSIPLENCTSHLTCNECVASPDPLCGWCSVEAKCSRVVFCQNSSVSDRYIENGQTEQCFHTVTVDPKEFVTELIVDNSFEITLTFSPGDLPQTLTEEIFLCQFSSSEMSSPFTTPLVDGACDVRMLVDQLNSVKLVTKFTMYSNLTEVDFVTVRPEYTFLNCSLADRCSECVETNGTCGWCVFDFSCTADDFACSSGSSTRKTLSTGQTYEDVCPLLLPFEGSSDGSYSQPVEVVKNLILSGKNLPNATNEHSYQCAIDGLLASLPGIRQSEEVVECVVSSNSDVTFIGDGTDGSQTRGFQLVQQSSGSQLTYNIEKFDQMAINVNLYQCSVLASVPDCSLCLAQNAGTGFECGWCLSSSQCLVKEECADSGFVTESGSCPPPVINSVTPNRGPLQGGTTIIVVGTNLGVSMTDIINITVGDLTCDLIESSYMPGLEVTCVISSSDSEIERDTYVVVFVNRTSGMIQSAMAGYSFRNATVESVFPTFGPVSGGTSVRVTGSNLDIGNSGLTRVHFRLSGSSRRKRQAMPIVGNCTVMMVNSTVIECISGPLTNGTQLGMSASVLVVIDSAMVTDEGVSFQYKQDPDFDSLIPQKIIPSGGITLSFAGSSLDVVQQPLLEITDSQFSQTSSVLCQGSPNLLTCIAPALDPYPIDSDYDQELNYTVTMDNASGPDITQPLLGLVLRRDPIFMDVAEPGRMVPINSNMSSITVRGENLESVERSEVSVTIGQNNEECLLSSYDDTQLICTAPLREEEATEEVYVQVGRLSPVIVGELMYVGPGSSFPLAIVGAVVGVLVATVLGTIIIVVLMMMYFRLKIKNIAHTRKEVEPMLSTEHILLPIQENIGYQSATAALLAQKNPAYSTVEEVHMYDYIPADEVLSRNDQRPPQLPPDRNTQVKDADSEGDSEEGYVNDDLLPAKSTKNNINNRNEEGCVNDNLVPSLKIFSGTKEDTEGSDVDKDDDLGPLKKIKEATDCKEVSAIDDTNSTHNMEKNGDADDGI